jgi:flagellar protein FliL
MASTTPKVTKGSGLLGSILVVVFITAMAAGAGVGTAWLVQAVRPANTSIAKDTHGPIFDMGLVTRTIAPVIGSLAGPKKAWIRLEFAVLLPPDLAKSDELAGLIAQDTLAYVRTVPLDQVDTPSGLWFLREDIEERVKVRTDGKAKGVLFRSLVIE